MPNQTVTIKLHDAKTIISAFQVTKTHDQPVTIQAQKGINYELIDDATQFAPENIKIQRVGDDLYISFEADGDSALDPDLIIQGYYGTDGNITNLLIGLHENGNYYAYIPESGLQQNAVSMLADQMSAGQALGGEALTSAAYEFNPYWLLALIPIVGLAAAGGGGGGGGGGTPAPSADKPDVVALDGGQVTVKPGSNNVKQVITYTDESDNPVTLTATKGSDGSWSLDQTLTGVTINPSTGEVTIGMDAVKDGSTVTSTGTNSSNNTATDSDTAKVDDSTPTSADAPDVTALATGAVAVKPGEDNVKQVITYTDESDNPVTLTATKGEDGTWSLDNTPANVLIDPTTGIVVIGPDAVKDLSTVTSVGNDAYNNTATDSDTAKVDETDTQNASLLVTFTSITDDTGSSSTDFITKDNTLLFNGKVAIDASTALSVLSVKVGGTTYSTSDQNSKLTVDGSGNWTLDLTGTNLADGAYAVIATVTDTAGNSKSTTTQNVVIDTKIDTDSDGKTVTFDSITNDTGTVGDFITNDNTLLFEGTVDLDDGNNLSVKVGGTTYTTADSRLTVDALGNWMLNLTGSALADGTYAVIATVTDTAGNSKSTTSQNVVIDTKIDTDSDGKTVTFDSITDDTGIPNDLITNDNTLLFKGTVDLDDGNNLSVKVGDTTYTTADSSLTVDGSGNWTLNLTGSALADGTYAVVATVSDKAGNSKSTTSQNVVIDTSVDKDHDGNIVTFDSITDDTGTPKDLITNDNTLVFKGTVDLDDGNNLSVSVGGTTYTTADPRLTVDVLGNWTLNLKGSALSDGTYPVVATVTDSSGNTGSSVSKDVVIDTKIDGDGDGKTVTFDSITDDTGTADDFITNDNTLLFQGTVDLDDGNSLSVTVGADTYTTADPRLTIDGSGNWTLNLTGSALADGTYPVVATVTDTAGNSKSTTSQNVVIDTIAPIASIDINPITSDSVITLSEAVGTINVSGSVSGEYQIGDEVTLTINNQIYTTQIQSGGVWSVAVSGSELVDDGDLTIEASAIVHDAAGNPSTIDTTESYTLDLTTLSVTLDEALLTSQGSAEVTSQLSGTYTDLALVVPNISLSSQGNPITWTLSADGKTLTGATTQNDVLRVTLTGSSNAWSYQVELLDSIDHAGDVESLIFTLEDDGSPILEKISVDIIDDVPILAENVTYDFGDTPSIYFGNAVDSFGADGGHLTTATINGVTYTYDALADSITYTGSTTQFDPDNYSFEDGVLSLTTNFGDSIRINFQTGEYSVESTGEGIGTEPAQVAPTAMIADQGGLLGSVGLNALDLIDLTANQKFTVADANNDITSASLSLTTNLGGAVVNALNLTIGPLTLPIGSLIAILGLNTVLNAIGGALGGVLSQLGLASYGLTASQDLATELGITITIGDESFISDGSGGYVYGQTITFTLTNSDPVSTQAFNELLASITVDDAFLGDIAVLNLAPTYTLNVVDSLAQSDTEVSIDVANASLLGNLLGSDTSGFLTEGTAGGESIDKSAETTSQRIYGYAGDDTLTGGSGNDLIRGGSGDDTIVAGNGNDLIYGGTGNDELTGNDGTDVFVWEQGDGGSTADPAIDIITDFNTASAAIGGDVLDLSGLLQGEGKIGNLVGNLAAYIHFETVNNQTEIWISTTGEFTGGYDASESSKVDQKIILSGVDYDVDTRTDAEIIQELLSKGKLIVDDLYGSVGSQESLEIDFTAIDNDLDVATKLSDGTSTTTVNLDSTMVEPETDLVDPSDNSAPFGFYADRDLLGIIDVGALGLIDLDQQVFGAFDLDNNIEKVEITYQPIVNVGLTKLTLEASERLAQEFGLKLSYSSTDGTLSLLNYSYTLTVTALDSGAIDNVKLNELLATVQLANESGTLLNSSTLSLNVLKSMTMTVTDTNGEEYIDSGTNLLGANVINDLGDNHEFITEGTNISESIDQSAASMGQRIYAYDGDDVITGSNFNDWIRAGSGDDTVNAGSGNDVIFGGLGDDIIDGGTGNDRILGEAGNDTIIGGSGSDTVMFQVLDGEESDNAGGNGTDTWLDFHLGNITTDDQADKIDISDLLVNYSGDGSAASLSDYLSVNSDGTDTTIRIDRDGAGGQYESTDLVVLKGVDTTLTELITNQQIIL